MNRNHAAFIRAALFATLGTGWVGCTQKNTFVEPPPPEVTVASPEIRTVTVYKTAPGRLQATEAIEIRARVSGHLPSVDFVDGQR